MHITIITRKDKKVYPFIIAQAEKIVKFLSVRMGFKRIAEVLRGV